MDSVPISRTLLLALPALACRGAAPPAAHEDPTASKQAGVRVERRVSAMGTLLTLEVEAGSRAEALAASEAAVRAVEAAEGRLSTWSETSELARLNRHPVDEPFRASPELAADLARAHALWRDSEGAFDPGLGALVEAWGLRTGGRRPTPAELAGALESGGLGGFDLAGAAITRRHGQARIEEGGFGKGVGLDAGIAALAEAGARRAILDLGGQVALLGPGERTFPLADPRDRGRAVLELTVDGGSFATSAASERGIVVDGQRRSHVLDPATGEPAHDFGSATVWARDATGADALSTALFVLGPGRGLAWAEAREGVEALFLVVEGERLVARASSGWRGRLRVLEEGLRTELEEGEGQR